MLNGKVDDPRDPMETMTLDDQIDYAEWQVSVAQSHLADLMLKKAELEAHYDALYDQHCEIEKGRVACEADAAECNHCKQAEVARC